MGVPESIGAALSSIAANKLRAGLTMLGIIMGVAAVISLMGIGQGVRQGIDAQMGRMGTNLLFLSPGSTNVGGVNQGAGSVQSLTYEDALALVDPELAPAVVGAAPETNSFGQIVYLSGNVNSRIVGVTPSYEQVRDFHVESGEFISQANVDSRSSVVLLGSNVAATLFEGADPVGQTVRINNIPFRVLGVLESKGGSGFGNQDDQVLVPLTTVLARLQRGRVSGGGNVANQISVQVASSKQMDAAIEQISAILRERHDIRYEDDFTIRSQEDLLATATEVSTMLTMFLGAIAGISLLVGGIGIMNIMLVSVTERTREIGIRKAVGATSEDVLGQFLTEAIILSLLGGATGILAGTGIARLISGLQLGSMNINSVVTASSVLLATAFSTAIGLFFGIYPAVRAAALNPIEALRYE